MNTHKFAHLAFPLQLLQQLPQYPLKIYAQGSSGEQAKTPCGLIPILPRKEGCISCPQRNFFGLATEVYKVSDPSRMLRWKLMSSEVDEG